MSTTRTAGRLDSLLCVALVALDELDDLIDADPAAAYSNRAVRRTADTLRRDWIPELDRLSQAELGHDRG